MSNTLSACHECRLWLPLALLMADGFMGTLNAQETATHPPPPDTNTGQWEPRAKLEERGISPFAVLTSEVWGNVAGGVRRKAWWNSLLDFGVELNTAKLGWWEGGAVQAQARWIETWGNRGWFANSTGALNPVSSAFAADHLRVFNLYYRHAWRDDAWVLKLGQIAADDDFMRSEYAGLFANAAFGPLPSQVGTPLASCCGSPPAFPIFPVAAPGIFFSLRPTEPFSTQLGLYYGRPGFDTSSNYGFDWASQTPPELGLFWENGYSYRLDQRTAAFRLGLSYHTGLVDDFRGNNAGEPATRQAVPNFYAIHDLQLLADREGKTVLGAFCRCGVTPEPNLSMVAAYADAGLNWFAPLPTRPEDVAGAAVSYTRYGREFRRGTSPNGVAADETTLEITYRAQVTRRMALQADIQWLFNPARASNSNSRETATVLGLRAVVSF